jgi:long-chain acyl-CoA synthetase
MTDPVMDGRAAVMSRLSALFTEWPDQQAIQFEGTWWTWGHVGHVAAALAAALGLDGASSARAGQEISPASDISHAQIGEPSGEPQSSLAMSGQPGQEMARPPVTYPAQSEGNSTDHPSTTVALGTGGEAASVLLPGAKSNGGAPIAIVMRQRPAMVGAELAVLASGRTALLVSPLQPDGPLATDIAAISASVVVAHSVDWQRPGFANAVAAAQVVGIEIDDDGGVVVRITPFGPRRVVASLEAAVTVLTSGTTGPAKRLPVSWASFVALGGGPEGREARSGRGAVILSLPLTTLGGLLSMSRLVFGGRPLSMMDRFDVRTWAALVKEHRPKVMGAPPPVVKMILDADISPDHFVGIEAYLTSSAAVAPEVARAFEARYGIPVLLGYGATEFLNSVTGWTTALWNEFGATKLGSVGRAYPGVRLRVLDPDDDHDLAPDEPGILEVDPPQRAGHLPAGWLRTSDRARIDHDGFLWILGRTDDVIVRGGFKVDLATVTTTLIAHPSVAAACVVGLPDDRLGTVPAAVVQFVDGESITQEVLVDWVREHLPPYAVPVVIRPVPSIPQTSTFKPDRVAIRELLRESYPS